MKHLDDPSMFMKAGGKHGGAQSNAYGASGGAGQVVVTRPNEAASTDPAT